MKTFARRLQALENTNGPEVSSWTDEQLINRSNEISLHLRPYGFDFPFLDGGPEDTERLRVAKAKLEAVTKRH